MANGVATVDFQRVGGRRNFVAKLVTQKGAISVTNPDGSATPEVMNISDHGFTPFVQIDQWSSLVPYGAKVLASDSEYLAFAAFFSRVASGFEAHFPAKTNYTLDFEYKKIAPGALLVKQVRGIPSIDPHARETTYLLNSAARWEVFQGEYGTVFGNHRLKSRWQLPVMDAQLTASNLARSLYLPVTSTHAASNQIVSWTHALPALPGARHTLEPADSFGQPVTDSWVAGSDRLSLTAWLRTSARQDESPFTTLADSRLIFSAEYATPLRALDYSGAPITVTNEDVLLKPAGMTNARSILQRREFTDPAGVSIRTEFFWPEPPRGAVAGYTAPLQQWVETVIEGLVAQPIRLRGYFSQTYRPEHHNFAENFLFEPALEEGIAPEVLDELALHGIRYVYFRYDGDGGSSYLRVAGPDWQFREVR